MRIVARRIPAQPPTAEILPLPAAKQAETKPCSTLDWLGPEPGPQWWKPYSATQPNPPKQWGKRCRPSGVRQHSQEGVPAEAARSVRQNFGRFRLCYEQAWATIDPELHGFWAMRISVAEEGKLCSVETLDSNVPDEFRRCLEEGVKRIDFSSTPAGKWDTLLTFGATCQRVSPGSH